MSDATPEEWRWVVDYEGIYQVSSHGRVYSLPRARSRGGLLKQSPNGRGGRLEVNLTKNGAQKVRRVHRLVAEAFHGPRPEGMETCHRDGDVTNNHASNLYYGTHKQNMEDMIRHGRGNMAKTHCPKGHLYAEGNIRWMDGRRACLTCERTRGLARYHRTKTPTLPRQLTCPGCGTEFTKLATEGRRKYCTEQCGNTHRNQLASQRRKRAA